MKDNKQFKKFSDIISEQKDSKHAFIKTNLSQQSILKEHISNKMFNKVDFNNSQIRCCIFENCDFVKCNFNESMLIGNTFKKCIIKENSFKSAQIKDSSFDDDTFFSEDNSIEDLQIDNVDGLDISYDDTNINDIDDEQQQIENKTFPDLPAKIKSYGQIIGFDLNKDSNDGTEELVKQYGQLQIIIVNDPDNANQIIMLCSTKMEDGIDEIFLTENFQYPNKSKELLDNVQMFLQLSKDKISRLNIVTEQILKQI